MKNRPYVFVIDDEPQILRVFRAGFPQRGFEVRVASNGVDALEEIRKEIPDLVILDLVMPGISGIDVCREIRSFSEVPIIVLSAKGAERDKVTALESGADDYVTKPFGMDELIARIRAVLRRVSGMEEANGRIQAGEIVIDIPGRRVTVRDVETKLTPKEFEVLLYLMRNSGKVVTHRNLLRAAWGWQSAEQTEYLRVFINQLRKKIEEDPRNPKYIRTEPWIGYRFQS